MNPYSRVKKVIYISDEMDKLLWTIYIRRKKTDPKQKLTTEIIEEGIKLVWQKENHNAT